MTETERNATGGGTAGPDRARAELLNVETVAGLLNCSPRHVYRLSDAGRMPRPVKLGSLIRWNRAQLDAWIADGCPPVRNVRGGAR